ncbi:MAG TPA: GGDEF domain-containing protein [Burkholderiaceae bacterium]|nr:GGDEF domain-containing protein [Burkholderiaceae bacterium]
MGGPDVLGDDSPAEARFVDVHRRLLGGLDGGQLLIALYDDQDRLHYANQLFRTTFLQGMEGELDFESIVRFNHARGTGVRIRDLSVDDYLVHVQQRRRSQPRRAFPVELIDGRRFWLTETLLDDGWLLCEACDITAVKRAEMSLRISRDMALEASQTDFLTKLPNRRYGYTFLEHMLTFARTEAVCISVALIDLDYFKLVNDRFGHEAGDLALCRFADMLRTNMRASEDLAARIGGEEFLVIWPNAGGEIAVESLMRLRARPLEVELPGGANHFAITFSAGVAQARPDDTVQSLLDRADRMLYAVKTQGRNDVKMDNE